jgi:hypothetical protein
MRVLSIIKDQPVIKSTLDRLKYLEHLSEDMLYTNNLTLWPEYAPISSAPLSTDDKFTLLDLRIRSLNARMRRDP